MFLAYFVNRLLMEHFPANVFSLKNKLGSGSVTLPHCQMTFMVAV